MKHPIQPIYFDNMGVARFHRNAIVRYLLDNGGLDLTKLAEIRFSDEDQAQFAMLIGYSVDTFCDADYVSDALADKVLVMLEDMENMLDGAGKNC